MDKLVHQYAETLLRLIEQGKSPQEAVAALRQTLARRGHEKLLRRTAHAFMRLVETRRRRSEVVLAAARAEDIKDALAEASKYLDAYDPEAVRTAIDDTLIGGWRLQGADIVVDTSYKRHLLNIFRNVTSKA